MAFGIENLNWEKIKSFIGNAIVGAIVISIVGFSWLGWVLESTANQKAKQMSEQAVIVSLAEICVYQASQDSGKDLKFKELIKESSWTRDDYVINQGWSTMAGEEEPESGVADKCAELLMEINQ